MEAVTDTPFYGHDRLVCVRIFCRRDCTSRKVMFFVPAAFMARIGDLWGGGGGHACTLPFLFALQVCRFGNSRENTSLLLYESAKMHENFDLRTEKLGNWEPPNTVFSSCMYRRLVSVSSIPFTVRCPISNICFTE